jgi:hypothetical protein
MSASDNKDAPEGVAEGPYESSNGSRPADSERDPLLRPGQSKPAFQAAGQRTSTSENENAPGESTEDSHESSNESESTDSIWGTRLEPGQIRLFKIELDGEDEIRGTLEVFEHNSAPDYIAQSYVCGEGGCDSKIIVNGNAHYIKRNLYIALRQTKETLEDSCIAPFGQDDYIMPNMCIGIWGPRFGEDVDEDEDEASQEDEASKDAEGSTRRIVGGRLKCSWFKTSWLWIDAICIHQSDISELETQIQFMTHVYKGARSTFVSLGKSSESQRLTTRLLAWVGAEVEIIKCEEDEEKTGQPDKDRDQVVGTIRSLQEKHESRLQADFKMSGEAIKTVTDVLKSSIRGELLDVDPSSEALSYAHPFWQACIEFFESDWFTRLWTYQELCLSRNAFMTLQICVHWSVLNTLYSCLLLLNNTNVEHNRIRNEIVTGSSQDFLYRFNMKVTSLSQLSSFNGCVDARHNAIWILLVIAGERRAKVPKDRVFAIRGLLDADTQKLVDVDYSKTDAQVFRGILQVAARAGSHRSPFLTMLWDNFAWVPTITPGLPSWVPDFSNETSARIGWWNCRQLLSGTVLTAFSDAAKVFVSPDTGPMYLKILEVDVVSVRCSEPCPTWSNSHASAEGTTDADILAWIKCLCDTMSGTGDDLPAVKARLATLFAVVAELHELHKEQIVALTFLIEASQLPIEGLTIGEVVLQVKQGLHPTHELCREVLESVNADAGYDALLRSLHSVAALLKAHFERTYVFATVGGHWGYSPKPISPGDAICIVPGGLRLYVFSPTSSRYVTCAAVPNLMGENLADFVRKQEEGLRWIEVF